MTETNKVKQITEAAMAWVGMGPAPASGEPASDEPAGRAHDEPAPDDQAALVPVLSAVERINAVLDEIEAAKARKGEAARVMQDVVTAVAG
jgi:hypothetical protein